MSINQILVIALAALLIWWPIGGLINRHRGEAWLDWLRKGASELGTPSAPMWLRSFHSVGQLKLSDLRHPFKSLDVLITLESRDNLFLWFLRHLNGRRDEMIVQAELEADPVQEIEVGDRIRRSYDVYLKKQKDNPFTELSDQNGLRIARRGETDDLSIAYLRKFLAQESRVIQRMTLQRTLTADMGTSWSPRQGKNLLMRVNMTRMDKNSPNKFFAELREWAENLALEPATATEVVRDEPSGAS